MSSDGSGDQVDRLDATLPKVVRVRQAGYLVILVLFIVVRSTTNLSSEWQFVGPLILGSIVTVVLQRIVVPNHPRISVTWRGFGIVAILIVALLAAFVPLYVLADDWSLFGMLFFLPAAIMSGTWIEHHLLYAARPD